MKQANKDMSLSTRNIIRNRGSKRIKRYHSEDREESCRNNSYDIKVAVLFLCSDSRCSRPMSVMDQVGLFGFYARCSSFL